jgi:hypothetical protein
MAKYDDDPNVGFILGGRKLSFNDFGYYIIFADWNNFFICLLWH